MKRLMIFFLLMAMTAISASGQTSSKTAELGWLELPAFSEDPEHFFVDVGNSDNENASDIAQRHFLVMLGSLF